ncbi:MAG: Lrp/AsnC family transcriptional regulator [Nitrososphaera sp.]|uniref:Lrp/AsnC family transcriptional regulator n=1 Tax=Nitrososphaera sp. TaxID=1971748 RepID=UPI003D6EB44B
MVSAFILINCSFSLVPSVMKELDKVPAISNVYQTSGIYDLVVRINSATEKELRRTLMADICTIENVKSTVTMIVAG